jgi:O-antigen/teichoic acid export membrane protein
MSAHLTSRPPAHLAPARPSRLLGIAADAGRDPLVRNSLYLMLTTLTMALAGLGFWVVNAHLHSAAQIGRATTLIAAVTLLSYFSLAGLNSTLIRRLPTATDQGAEVSTAVGVVLLASVVLALGYLALQPLIAPSLGFIHQSPLITVAFVLLVCANSLNLLTDSIFIAVRAAGWNLVLDGVLMGVAKLALPFALVGMGAFGVFAASSTAAGLAAGLSLLVVHRRLRIRLQPRIDARLLLEAWSFSAVNYLASCLNLLPVMLMPLALLDGAGPVAAGGFFVAYQIATILNSVSYAVCEAMFAEDSYVAYRTKRIAVRAAGLIAVITVPAIIVVLLTGKLVLRMFGVGYPHTAGPSLIVLAIGTLAVGFYSWTNYLLKITRQLGAIVWTNVVYAAVIVGLAYAWADRGAVWVAAAWGIGNAAAGVVAMAALGAFLIRNGPGNTPARHARYAR